ncbi:MAG: TRAP transporter substrate-binding protein DctP [Planctomycetota bacterium]|jgi:TRAP-type C4-dicarboxylate transport system substrate-binding protein|nr:TRAP transporter substrate-binding protein DctP [Planctomycetota bacterium]
MIRSTFLSLLGVLLTLTVSAEESKTTIIKVATIAPDGTAWTDTLEEAQREIREKTQGEVELKLFTGGSQGDEQQVLDKLRNGTIDAAGLTGAGFGEILSEVRILEVPLLFRNYEEYDFVRQKLTPYFFKRFKEKGFVLLSWAEGGFAYFMSQKDISSMDKLRASKVWLRQGDAFNKLCLDAIDIHPIPLSLSDVILGIQRGTIETIYVSPLGLIAFQWHPHIKYRVDLPLCNIMAGFVISDKAFETIPERHRRTVRQIFWTKTKALVQQVRRDNEIATSTLKKQGIITLTVPDKLREEYEQKGQETAQSLVGEVYPRRLYDVVSKLLAQHRAKQASPE